MLEYPTLHQVLRAEEEQIQLLLSIAAHCKAFNELEDRQKKLNSQNVTQQMEYKHELDTEVNTTPANEEEMSDEEADISRPPIDLWKPLGQIGDSSFDSLEHHPDTSIALNVNNDVRFQSSCPDMIFFDDSPDLPSPPLTHARQQSMHNNAHYTRSRDPPASPCETEVATKANIEVSPSSDHVAMEPLSPSRSVEIRFEDNMEMSSYSDVSETDEMMAPLMSEKPKTVAPRQDDTLVELPYRYTDSYDSPSVLKDVSNSVFDVFKISELPILTSSQSSDDSAIPQFNDDEDAAYLQSNHMEDHLALNGSRMIISDRRRLQEKVTKATSGTITYRGSSPGGTSVDFIEILDSPSPPAISHNDYINVVASDEQVNNEGLNTESFHNSHSVSEEFAAMDESEDALATHYKPLPAKRLQYYRNGLGRSYAKSMNTKRPTRGWIKRKP